MDKNILITAHHEAGHALMAHIFGWKINSIELIFKNEILQFGVTNYNFGEDKMNNWKNINRRVHCLMGGPIAQAIYENNNLINIDALGKDGVSIDSFLSNLDKQAKENTIQEAINTTATFLKMNSSLIARQFIVEKLIINHKISQAEFIEIVRDNNVVKIDFD